MKPGQALPSLTKMITQEVIRRYAEASGDFNPIHLDEEYAASTPFGGVIAHGMLVMAYISEMLTAAFGRAWLESGRLRVRFRGPARPGDTLIIAGHVQRATAQENGRQRIECQVECRNQRDEVLISGDAQVVL
jgi:3-hydroxybutyryl-CoA dehydratase